MNNLPVGWINNDLRTVLEKIIDYRGQSVPKADTGVPLITARNVKKGYLDFSSKEYVDESLYSVWMSRGVPVSTDILFTTEAPLGNACRYPSGEKYAIGQRIVCLRVKKNILDSDYLLYFLLSDHGQTLIDIKSSGSTAKGIKSSELKKIKLTYPESISEQIKIADILSTWDNAINTVQKLLANSQQQKKSLIQQLLTGKKRFFGFEGEWEEKRLGEVSQITKGKAISSKDVVSGCYPVIAGGKTSPYSHNDFTHEKVITVSASGAYAGYIWYHQNRIWASDCSVIQSKRNCDIIFLYYWLEKKQSLIYSLQSGGAQPHIYPKDLGVLKIYTPSLLEQQKIAAVLTTADQEIDNLRAQLNHLKQEKKALMQQLLTGKRRVKIEEAA